MPDEDDNNSAGSGKATAQAPDGKGGGSLVKRVGCIFGLILFLFLAATGIGGAATVPAQYLREISGYAVGGGTNGGGNGGSGGGNTTTGGTNNGGSTQPGGVSGGGNGGTAATGRLSFPTGADRARLATCLHEWMLEQSPSSPLANMGGVFVAAGETERVNPALMVAIGMQETALGTTGMGPSTGNYYGLTETDGSFATFVENGSINWGNAVNRMGRYIGRGYLYYSGDARTTIPDIGRTWAPVGADNDPNGLNSHWVPGVTSHFNSIVQRCPDANRF